MFEGYRDAIDTAEEVEEEINTRFDGLKEAHSLSQQKMMEAEAKKMRGGQQLKDYNPTEFANEITRMKHEFDQIEKDEQAELDEAKANLDKSLSELMGTSLPFTEMYKVIGCDVGTNYNRWICRVWFTLVPIKQFKCVPGDPIRVEWVDMMRDNTSNKKGLNDNTSHITSTSSRTGCGITGLNIPNFVNENQLNSKNNFYNVDSWGETSNQKSWWIAWVNENRPIPERT